jgi:hypothetical protein
MTKRFEALVLAISIAAPAFEACGGRELDAWPPASAGGGIESGGSAGIGGAGDAGQTSGRGSIYEGSYRVPVSAELEPFATYPIGSIRFWQEGGMLEIRYGFPRWLSGVSKRIELVGNYADGASEIDVSAGELGTGTCVRDGAAFECYEVLPGLTVNRDMARERMIEGGLSPQEIEGRLKVTDSFAVDPIGILSFRIDAE